MYELEEKMEANERSIFDKSRAQTEEKQLYEAITTSIAEALVVINKDKQILMFNTEAEKLIGTKSSAVEYRSYEKIISFFDENKRKIKKDPIKEALEKGQIIHISSRDGFHLKAGSGDLVPVAVNIAPVAEGKSFVKGVAVTIIDISTERELQKVKDEFVYVVAHELGNPIFALDGYLSLMEGREKALGKDGKEILNSAQGINRQLSSLVNDLLEVARNETGRLTFDMEKINLGAILAEVIKNSDFKAREKNIKIVFKNKKAPMAIGNERKIKEVATNLVDNAIKYTKKSGTVEVDVFQHENRVIVEIKDNGVGISPENQKHLFEKFYRVKNKATEGISGTGLGLFIAKQIVEKCGGKIWAISEEDKGSTFYFSLKTTK
jgi:PAS domain S-box-containing protein